MELRINSHLYPWWAQVLSAVSEYVLNSLVCSLGPHSLPGMALAPAFLFLFMVPFSFMALGDLALVLTGWAMHLKESLHHFVENV